MKGISRLKGELNHLSEELEKGADYVHIILTTGQGCCLLLNREIYLIIIR